MITADFKAAVWLQDKGQWELFCVINKLYVKFYVFSLTFCGKVFWFFADVFYIVLEYKTINIYFDCNKSDLFRNLIVLWTTTTIFLIANAEALMFWFCSQMFCFIKPQIAISIGTHRNFLEIVKEAKTIFWSKSRSPYCSDLFHRCSLYSVIWNYKHIFRLEHIGFF